MESAGAEKTLRDSKVWNPPVIRRDPYLGKHVVGSLFDKFRAKN